MAKPHKEYSINLKRTAENVSSDLLKLPLKFISIPENTAV